MKKKSFLLLLLVLGLNSFSQIGNLKSVNVLLENTFKESIKIGENVRYYNFHIPERILTDTNQLNKYPLILAFHGWYQTPESMEKQTEFSKIADEKNFIVAYLAYLGPNPSNNSWNYFLNPDKAHDLEFCTLVIDTLLSRYLVDTTHVYATGFSDGGGMPYMLANELPYKIKAIATVAGIITYPDSISPQKVPIIHFQAENDNLSSRKEQVLYWTNTNECDHQPDTLINKNGVLGLRWKDADDNYPVILYSTNSGGHTWPGSPRGNPSKKISASELIWEFFMTGTAIAEVSDPPVNINSVSENTFKLDIKPNPITSMASISISINKTEIVEISVFNAQGQKISTIAKSLLTKGNYEYEWNVGNSVINGIYYIQLSSNSSKISQKVIVLK